MDNVAATISAMSVNNPTPAISGNGAAILQNSNVVAVVANWRKPGKTVTYVTADGRVIEPSKIRKDSKVHVHYIKDGDDMLVDKVIVTKDRD